MSIIDMAFRIIFIVIMVRILLSWIPSNNSNQAFNLIFRLTEPFIRPIRQLLPSQQGGLDLAPILLMLIVYLLKEAIVSIIKGLLDPVSLIFDLLYFVILARVILSWVPHNRFSPIAAAIYRITEPILRPLRELLPPLIGGIDFTPIIAMIALSFVRNILLALIYSQ
tara:strand:+ start:1106 stop:1606 length:501 start_codon:yes stop_codon:yes gene_type:complete